jgi:nucleoside-diphosphate-sugar epimerase
LYDGVHSSAKPYVEVNLLGTINIIDACEDVDYECLVNTGSSAEYGPKEKKMNEQDLCNPQIVYAITKLAGTNYASCVGKTHKKPVVTLRLFSPYGPYDDPKRLMSEAIVNALEGKPIFFSRPNIVRDYIYIEEVVDAYLKVVEKAKNYKGEIFNLGSGQETTIQEVISEIIKITGSRSRTKWGVLPPRDFESPVWQADMSKMRELIGWKPQKSLQGGLEKTIYWYKKNLDFYRDKIRRF